MGLRKDFQSAIDSQMERATETPLDSEMELEKVMGLLVVLDLLLGIWLLEPKLDFGLRKRLLYFAPGLQLPRRKPWLLPRCSPIRFLGFPPPILHH